MTNEQYYWFVRRQQLMHALRSQMAAGCGNPYERDIKINLKERWFDNFIEKFNIIPDYAQNTNTKAVKSPHGACSSVRRGNFHGRNYDFTFDAIPSYVVHVRKHGNKHAFAGIAKASFNEAGFNILELPNLMKDGINDAGVAININVVSKKDLDDVGYGNTETQPGTDLLKVHCDCVPAYVLSYADSAVDAVERMKSSINIYGYLKGGNEESNEYLHYMISDKINTFVVEIIKNELHVIGYNRNSPDANERVGARVLDEFPNPIMTNWYLNHDILPEDAIKADNKYTYHACGIERFKILSKNYNSNISMFELMKKAKYTNAIELNVADARFPYSDLTGRSVYDYQMYLDIPELRAFIDGEIEKMKDALKNNKRNLGIWLTSHNTIYDLQNKTFTLVFEEDYNNVMKFEI